MIASKRLYMLLVVVAVIFCFSFLWQPLVKLAIVLDLVLFIALAIDFSLTQKPNLVSVEREVSDRLSIGRTNSVQLNVTNGGLTNLKCRLKESVPAWLRPERSEFEFDLKPSVQVTLSYFLFPTKRGVYRLGDIYLKYLSFLGLFWRQTRLDAQVRVKVFSDLKALTDLSIKLSSSSELGELRQAKRGQGTDFASLREYVNGDDNRSIDWKATARRNHPILRTYEAEQEQKLLILIDAGRMMVSELAELKRFDHALNAALCLALTGLTYNDQVGIGIFADKPLLYLPPRRGRGHIKKILEVTADIEPRMVEPDYAGMLAHFATLQKSRSLFAVLTDLTDASGSQALLSGLAHLRKRHLTFCITLKDKRVQEMAQTPEKTAQSLERIDIFRRAVAIDLMQQRELALFVLKQQGCLVLDEAPEQLSTKVIDKYLEIKRKALL